MKLILFTGAPASGKSSLAEELSRRTGIQAISKDGCKIRLFEQYGFTSHAEKKQLSLAGENEMYDLLEQAVSENRDIIVDNNFKDFDRVREVLAKFPKKAEVICVYCRADYDVLAKRYNERIAGGNRHPALYTLNQYPIIPGISEFHKEIDAGDVERIQKQNREETFGQNVLTVDTNHMETEFEQICETIKNYIYTEIFPEDS